MIKVERIKESTERDKDYGLLWYFDVVVYLEGEACIRIRECSYTRKDKVYLNPPRKYRGKLDGRAAFYEPVWFIGQAFKEVIETELRAALADQGKEL